MRRFSHVWGSSALAIALVVAAFLLGLGAGALVIGRRADLTHRPLHWYGLSEIAIGVFAVLVPFFIAWLAGLNAWLFQLFHGWPIAHALGQELLTIAVIGLPCFLMGGTLPLLVRQVQQESEGVASSTAWMYGINTAGAAVGCLAAGFLLIPALGMNGANLLMAAANVLIGGVALLGARSATKSSPSIGAAAPGAGKSSAPAGLSAGLPRSGRWVFVAALLAGFASLSLQMFWTRQLAVMLGGSTYAFSATLFIFLLGIGAGALLYRKIHARTSDPSRLAAVAVLLLVVGTVAGKAAIPILTAAVGTLAPLRSSQPLNIAVCLGAGAVLEFPAAAAMGFLFPLLVGLISRKDSRAGQMVGSIYAWNTLGSIAGAFLGGLVLVPALGIPGATGFALGLYAVMLLVLQWRAGNRMSRSMGLALAACVAGIAVVSRPVDPRRTDFGAYLYGYAPIEELREGVKVLSFGEGKSANVFVTESGGERSVRVNGKVDASTGVDMETQLALAYLPRFLRPEAKDVLVIGFGSGTTAGASLLFPDTRVVCCEIEPLMLQAAPFFSPGNHDPHRSERFTAVLDDGRSYLQSTERQFDLIISEPSNPWLAGMSSLYTREFYDVARRRLQKGGVFAQWVHMYALDTSDYAMIVRTLQTVFPHSGLLWINPKNTILLGANEPLTMDGANLERARQLAVSLPAVKADLQRYFQASSARALVLSRWLLGTDELKRLGASGNESYLHTDINLRLEFDAPRRLFRSPDPARAPARTVLATTAELLPVTRHGNSAAPTGESLTALKYQVSLFSRFGQDEWVARGAKAGLALAPDDPFFLSQLLLLPDALNDGAFAETGRKLVEVSPEEAGKVGSGLWQRRKPGRAAVIFQALLRKHPESATAWMNLSLVQRAMGRLEESEASRKRALQLDPLAGILRATVLALEGQVAKGEKAPLEATLKPGAGEEAP